LLEKASAGPVLFPSFLPEAGLALPGREPESALLAPAIARLVAGKGVSLRVSGFLAGASPHQLLPVPRSDDPAPRAQR